MIELNLDAGAPTPAFRNYGTRQGSAAGKFRMFAIPVYLPTGQIFHSGGIDTSAAGGASDTNGVREPEVHTPDIDWSSLSYGAGDGSWTTIEEPAAIPRNYHTVSLLLPDGSVFTASSSIDTNSGNPETAGQRNLEVFEPAYFSNPGRPTVTVQPPVFSCPRRMDGRIRS